MLEKRKCTLSFSRSSSSNLSGLKVRLLDISGYLETHFKCTMELSKWVSHRDPSQICSFESHRLSLNLWTPTVYSIYQPSMSYEGSCCYRWWYLSGSIRRNNSIQLTGTWHQDNKISDRQEPSLKRCKMKTFRLVLSITTLEHIANKWQHWLVEQNQGHSK